MSRLKNIVNIVVYVLVGIIFVGGALLTILVVARMVEEVLAGRWL